MAGESAVSGVLERSEPAARVRGPIGTAALDAGPVLVGIVPFGMAIGIAVGESSVHDGAGWAGSLLLFSGSAHMAAVSILAAGGGFVAVLVAVLLINARLLVYSALLAPVFRSQPRWFRWMAPYALLDQTYVLVAHRIDDGCDATWIRRYWLAMGAGILLVWPAAVAAGVLAGPVVPASWQLKLAAPLLLVGLLAPALRTRPAIAAALVAGVVATASLSLPAGSGLLLAAAAGTVAGVWVERRSS